MVAIENRYLVAIAFDQTVNLFNTEVEIKMHIDHFLSEN